MDKIDKLLQDGRVFLVTKGNNYDFYICKGDKRKVYEIIYSKAFDNFTCSCDNVRLNECKHIKAVRRCG